ncbi:protein quick-to-court isoform X2 [Phlebotomus argentipes]|uniref:protein quick-to-court isoform X2 n=1 Tax=Phlebotomus argentipes TaxID=94469 RepID=UPI00289371C7|nr:protein quick-to-court isoform X2 [Phlebotomus argentipes]
MTSNPSTPLSQRRVHANGAAGGLRGSRIPQLTSPQPFRRSVSLRLRGSKSTSSSNFASPTSPPKPFHMSRPLERAQLSGKAPPSTTESVSSDAKEAPAAGPSCNHHHYQFCDGHRPSQLQSPSEVPAGSFGATKRDHGLSLNLNNSAPSTSAGKSPLTPQTPKTPSGAGKTPKTPPVTPDLYPNGYYEDDMDSVHSYSSGRSTMSCEHAYVARNGTTFSGRRMKYVVHCSSYAGATGEDYLTPTQRAQRQIRRLREMLLQAKLDLEQKDSEILRLTKEVVELRLFKASLSSPEDRSNSSDAVTVRENTANDLQTSTDVSPIVDMVDECGAVSKLSPRHQLLQANHVQMMEKLCQSEMQSSFADSGHFEDMTTSSFHSKDSFVQTQDQASGSDYTEADRQELIDIYERRIEELIRQHDSEKQDIKMTQNDRVEALLQKMSESNARFTDLVPDYEQAKERIRELEKELEVLQAKLREQEDKQNKMYLHMYAKGQEAERLSHADQVMEFARQAPKRVSVPELLQQLQVTQDELENIKTMYRRLIDAQQSKNKVDPEVTLQFLKSAIYYFLTDKENSQGHLNAIESILGFSDLEKSNIDKARSNK